MLIVCANPMLSPIQRLSWLGLDSRLQVDRKVGALPALRHITCRRDDLCRGRRALGRRRHRRHRLHRGRHRNSLLSAGGIWMDARRCRVRQLRRYFWGPVVGVVVGVVNVVVGVVVSVVVCGVVGVETISHALVSSHHPTRSV